MYRLVWTSVHNKKKFIERVFSLLVIALINLSVSSTAMAVGLIPVPTLKNVTTQASATYDPVKQWYSYHYSVDNPATNTGEIWNIKIDISRRFIGGSVRLNPNGLMLPMGASTVTFSKILAILEPLGFPLGQSVVSIGQRIPLGWAGGFGRDGYAGFHARSNVTGIVPGSSLGGFVLISPGLPTIRKMQIIPNWMLVVPNLDDVTEAEKQQAGDIERKIIFHTHTLGPAGVTNFGGFSHWNLLRDDIEKAITLGWIPDTTLAGTIRTKLAFARKALDAQDGTLAKTRLQPLLATVQAITPGQKIRREAYDLIVLNIRSLLKHTANTPIPFKPAYSLTPPTSTLPLGKRQTLIARAFNVAFNNAPIPGEFFEARITKGPHMGLSWFLQTDANGEAPFSYVGKKVGKDHIIISRPLGLIKKKPVMLAFTGNLSTLAAGGTLLGGPPPLGGGATRIILAEAEVIWKGGPDLVVPFFMPPLIKSQGGNTVFITEVTANTGNLASPASTTRYYLSDSKVIDPNTAMVVGERLVDPLQPGQSSGVNTLKFTIHGALPAGTYYMAACADADQGVAELNEDNNCSFNQLLTSASMVVPLETVLDVAPPVVTVPADITIEATAILTPVSLGVATAIDARDGPLTATADKTGPFALGGHTVTWSATDAAGNTGTATQTVTVVDTTPPVLTVPADITVEANGLLSTVTIGTATATDIFPVTITNDIPATFPLGTTVVTWTATDANGNSSTAPQKITVVDTTPPNVIAQLVPVDVEEDEGTFRVVFSATDIVDPNPVISATLNGAAVSNGQIVELDRDEDVEVTFEHGKLKIKGMTFSLSVTATDASGNAATASADFLFRSERDDDKKSHDEEKKHKDEENHES